jgi:hypothetical protein
VGFGTEGETGAAAGRGRIDLGVVEDGGSIVAYMTFCFGKKVNYA